MQFTRLTSVLYSISLWLSFNLLRFYFLIRVNPIADDSSSEKMNYMQQAGKKPFHFTLSLKVPLTQFTFLHIKFQTFFLHFANGKNVKIYVYIILNSIRTFFLFFSSLFRAIEKKEKKKEKAYE